MSAMNALVAVGPYGAGFNFTGACLPVVPTHTGKGYEATVGVSALPWTGASIHGVRKFNPQPLTTERLAGFEEFLTTQEEGRGGDLVWTSRVGTKKSRVHLGPLGMPSVSVSNGTHFLSQEARIGARDSQAGSGQERLVRGSRTLYEMEALVSGVDELKNPSSINNPMVKLLLEGALAIFEPRHRESGELLTEAELWAVVLAKDIYPGIPFKIGIGADTLEGLDINSPEGENHYILDLEIVGQRMRFSVQALYDSSWKHGLHPWIQAQVEANLGDIIMAPASIPSSAMVDEEYFEYTVEGDQLVAGKR